MGIADHLTCLLKNLCAGQEATVRTGQEQWTGSKSERSTSRLCIVTLLIYLICRAHHVKCQLGEAQAGIKIAGRNIYNLRYANNTTHMAESEELKSLLMKVKEESEKLA